MSIMQQETTPEFIEFKKNIEKLIHLDLTNYKNAQMERRIIAYMQKLKIPTLHDFYLFLKNDPKELEAFVNMLTINVSEFFRNSDKFWELRDIYLKNLFAQKRRLKIWSAGCSIGAEIYSIAMILKEMGQIDNVELYASDFDQNILNKAKNGVYSSTEVGTAPKEYQKYFIPTDAERSHYQFDKSLAARVKFIRQDLLNSQFEKGFDLIICRNVVIYFTDEAKDILYKKFCDSLVSGGYLFIGSTERIMNYKAVGFETRTPFFYQKV